MLKILITWASGFIGNSLVERLMNFDSPKFQIWNLGRTPVAWTNFIDLNDFDPLDYDFDLVFHTLAMSSERFCSDFWDADSLNVGLTKKLIKYCESRTHCRLIFLSSVVLYDNSQAVPPVTEESPLNFFYNNYSFTKGVAEEYVRFMLWKWLNATIVRLSNVYGPWQLYWKDTPFLIPEKIFQWLHDKKVVIRNADTVRDWLYITDAVDALIKAIFDSKMIWVFNLGSGIWISTWEIWKIISRHLNVPFENLNILASGPQFFYSDISRISERLSWKPNVWIQEWLVKTIEYLKLNHECCHS